MEKHTAVEVIHEFMKCWERQDWKGILKYSQITWVEDSHPGFTAIGWFKECFFIGKSPVSWTLINIKYITDTIKDIQLDIVLKDTELNQSYTRTSIIRVICEKSIYNQSIDGKWGINPVSCLRF